ncbi:MAG: hypothetical protein I3I94_07665 [Acidaminococcaceae bacterium]|jgi:Fe-S-cluster-containing hydrogenase component 2|nr:hypothetical protein [Acidaminococcaceae bacterium]HAY61635.1 FeoB-associated Cys-rich membrane protein [Acidaminococcaceae bacterium]HCJ91363.1 FeoB-associated Cys-rich membrane protein [Acidaminococcaceae bacterium]
MNFLSAVVLAAVIICFIMALRHVVKNLSSGSCAHCSGCSGCAGACPKCGAASYDKKGKTGNA